MGISSHYSLEINGNYRKSLQISGIGNNKKLCDMCQSVKTDVTLFDTWTHDHFIRNTD